MTKIIANDLRVRLSSGGFLRTEEILKGVSFQLNDGDRLALVGANGAGKSTLLQTIAGVTTPSGGDLDIEGDVSALFHLNVGHRREMSGRRNMIVKNLLMGNKYKRVKQRLQGMIDYADIGEYIDRPMETYSQGMAMRVAFAAATDSRPDILLMDEWLGVGDMAFRKKSEERMQEMVESSGIIVMATHHQRLSRELCNLGLYMDNGKVTFFGDIDECWKIYLDDIK